MRPTRVPKRTFLLVVFFVAVISTAFAQRAVGFGGSRLLITPVANFTNDPELDRLAAGFSETLFQTLSFTGRFDVRRSDTVAYEADGSAVVHRGHVIGDAARRVRADGVLGGYFVPAARGGVEMVLELYGVAAGTVVGRESRTSFGAFDLIPTSDELLIAVARVVSGMEIDFGAVLIRTNRPSVRYRVYLDDVLIGENVTTISTVLVGRRRFSVAALNLDGSERLAFTSDILVRPGEALEVVVPLPASAAGDREFVGARLDFLRAGIDYSSDAGLVENGLQELSFLARGDDPAAAEPAAEYRYISAAWAVQREFESLRIDQYAGGAHVVAPTLEATWSVTSAKLQEYRTELQFGASGTLGGDVSRVERARHEFSERVERNLYAHLHLLFLRYAYLLSVNEVQGADVALAEMEQTARRADLALPFLAAERAAFDARRVDLVSLERRRRRPWPFLTTLGGLVSATYGGYLQSLGEVRQLRRDASEYERQALLESSAGNALLSAEWLQRAEEANRDATLINARNAGLLVGGGVAAVLGTLWATRVARAAEEAMPDWIAARHGKSVTVAVQLFEGAGLRNDQVLILGPPDRAIIGGMLDATPTIRDRSELASGIDRAPVALTDLSPRFSISGSVFVLR